MKKFPAVFKREYKKVVFRWTFLVTTLLMPLIASLFVLVPMFIFSIGGEPTRIAIADLNGKIAPRIKESLSPEKIAERTEQAAKDSIKNLSPSQKQQLDQYGQQMGSSFEFVDFDTKRKTQSQIEAELRGMVSAKKLDAFLVIPASLESENLGIKLFSRKAGDFVVNSALEDAVNEAVRKQRLSDANIDDELLKKVGRRVDYEVVGLGQTGELKGSDEGPFAAFIVAMLIYIVLAIYGQAIMSAIVEEKETRISEILFSSASPFELMLGKLVGVGMAGLTQLAIWIFSILAIVTLGAVSAFLADMEVALPEVSALKIIYFFLFFLLGYFIYATIYALIGSMVTSMQEGSQFAFPPVMLLLIGLYFCFAVVRDPNSTLAFWVSIAPFFAPVVMPVRILAETPPFWQIALAVVLNLATIIGLMWVASRVYRIGMLMYGKRATIPEVWKWIRQP
ncbi:MAG: ABC transporter permease [Pyrinomonadaceae bacterium]